MLCHVITHPYLNFDGASAKSPLNNPLAILNDVVWSNKGTQIIHSQWKYEVNMYAVKPLI